MSFYTKYMPYTETANVDPNRRFKFSIRNGSPGEFYHGAPRATTIEIFSYDAGREMKTTTSSRWNIKITHEYITVKDSKTYSYQNLISIEENVEGKKIEELFAEIDELKLETYTENYIQLTEPEIYMSKWYINADNNIRISGTVGVLNELIKRIKEIIDYDEKRREMIKLVYYQFSNKEYQNEYGIKQGINQQEGNIKTLHK